MAEMPTTQRAYTLRLRGASPDSRDWRNALWATHEAVNKGAKTFGDWLLTLRGGLDHDLAAQHPERRPFLALSWLSVEDERGAPKDESLIVARGRESTDSRRRKLCDALVDILQKRGVLRVDIGDPERQPEQQPDTWIGACLPSLSAAIRPDALWINRSRAFDAARQRIGDSLKREEVWDILEPFFGTQDAYFAPVKTQDEDKESDSRENEEKAKDLVQKAGGWLSSRFGAGVGADFERMAKVYAAIGEWAGTTNSRAIESLAVSLKEFNPASSDGNGILKLISGPGHKSATRNLISGWNDRADLAKLKEAASVDHDKCKANTGGKGPRPWSDTLLAEVESACRFTYLQEGGPARHKEFSVMLDHAARRVSIAHSWIKRAESQRQAFTREAQKIESIPAPAKAWLDTFCKLRSGDTGALDEGYRIRKRAIGGWKELVTKWSRSTCKTAKERVDAARELQANPEIDKFGDIQLFAGGGENELALAGDNAICVWQVDGRPDPQPLIDYVAATDAQAKRQRFKVPAYRHPDPLRHPVFCDFGYSRWEIRFDIHERHKAKKKRKARLDFHPRGLRMGLCKGTQLSDDIPLRWGCKRLVDDLAIGSNGEGEACEVTRADRLGRAAKNAGSDAKVTILGLFDQAEWNGRLQAPRRELDAIAKQLDRNLGRWDEKARKMCLRLHWLVSFSAKLQPQGPWFDYVHEFSDASASKPFVSTKGECAVKHADNDGRKGLAKLVLCRLPGLRLLSMDLGHRYAAACAVWETMSRQNLEQEITGRERIAGGIAADQLYLHTRHNDDEGKLRTTIYRRIGPDMWARLDRQFVVKLQGEERSPRAASKSEMAYARRLESELQFVRDERKNPLPRRIDELMSDTIRALDRALGRHGDAARIAFRLLKKDVRRSILPIEDPVAGAPIEHLSDVLMLWYDLATSGRWQDTWALDLWNAEILPLIQESPFSQPPPLEGEEVKDKRKIQQRAEKIDRWQETWNGLRIGLAQRTLDQEEREEKAQRKADREAVRSLLAPVASALFANLALRQKLSQVWAEHWGRNDDARKACLKGIRRWILPRNLGKPASDKHGCPIIETDQQRRDRFARRGGARNVGGLSLNRISTIRSLWQLYKAFRYRPKPQNTRAGIELLDCDAEHDRKFGDRMLQAMEHMREQRVKQLSSRIVEAALGIGSEDRKKHWENGTKRPRQRIEERRFAPCHAVVIENLTNYRPEEKRTRRENRQLMNWSASKVKKYLSEGCQLHGLHLREVSAAYTSRQDSRTGLPGIRCGDISAKEFQKPHWQKRVKQSAGKQDAESLLLQEVDKGCHEGKVLRLPAKGGDLFVSTDGRTLQADLNAAANIGLRALLDPDWAGRWWYVPCQVSTGKPVADKVKGSAAVPLDLALTQSAAEKAKSKDIINLWRHCSTKTLEALDFAPYDKYWNSVGYRVINNVLRKQNGLAVQE